MSESMPENTQNQPASGRSPISPRTFAILLMFVGVVCFVAAQFLFPEQVLCMVGSTLITFAGLGIIIAGRSRGWQTGRATEAPRQAAKTGWGSARPRVRPPAGLRVAASKMPPSPASRPVQVVPDEDILVTPVDAGPTRASLIDQTADILERQGAQVRIEAQREDRGILRIITSDGRVITAMVREDMEPVDVADVRALHALVSSSAAEAGYLIAAGPITERAYEWAGTRQIHLVGADELDELGV